MFSRVNMNIFNLLHSKIYSNLNINTNKLTCFGRDVLIPANLSFNNFKKIDIICHNLDIINLSKSYNPYIPTHYIKKNLYHTYLEQNNF